MGYLTQSPPTIANFSKFAISMWFRIPGTIPDYSAGANYTLFEIVEANFGREYLWVSVGSLFSGGVYSAPRIVAQIIGNDGLGAQVGGSMYSLAGDVSFGNWHPLFLSGDFSGAGSISAPPGRGGQQYPVRLILDGVNKIQQSGIDGTPGYIYCTPESYAPIMVIAQDAFDVITIALPYSVTATNSPDSPSNRARDYGDVQIWTNQYIDGSISGNFSKFVTISGGIGTPVDPSIAATAFGEQSFLFKGDHSHFNVNLGSGGTFTKVGTMSDFTPAPTYG